WHTLQFLAQSCQKGEVSDFQCTIGAYFCLVLWGILYTFLDHYMGKRKLRDTPQKSPEKPIRIWSPVCSFTFLAPLVLFLLACGLGVLSMNPPQVTLAYACFTLGYFPIGIRIGFWILQECDYSLPKKALFVSLVGAATFLCWFASIAFAHSRLPVKLNLT